MAHPPWRWMPFLLAAVACEPHAGVDPQPGTQAATEIGVAPFRFISTRGDHERELFHLDANGTLVGAQGEVLARVTGHSITRADGKVVAWVGDDRSVGIAGVAPGSSFDLAEPTIRDLRSSGASWALFTPAGRISLAGDLAPNRATPLIEGPQGIVADVHGYIVGIDSGNVQVVELVIALMVYRTLAPPAASAGKGAPPP